ncbi:BT1 family protein [Shimia abyssi]|uniref:BT1 family protein n=2 Tax=Shimia abyssi TaxID=1662395 RepID=A0A2P8EVU6_9RHOB|nr:BT1 family protein [Shimia abyssi]
MRGETQTDRRWIAAWWHSAFVDLASEMRWSYLPPLMVYFAAGVSGLTSVVGAFFLKEYLDLSASFVAGLAFWAGLPWILKIPMGHVVDLFWRWKALLILFGAALITGSLLIMFALVTEPGQMGAIMSISSWYVIALLLAPSGYAVQDVVADAMTVEAVPHVYENGTPLSQEEARALHTTMQTLGRVAIISGLASVAGVNIWIFSGVEDIGLDERLALYGRVYLVALAIPALSVSGVFLHSIFQRRKRQKGHPSRRTEKKAEVNWSILGGGLAFVLLSILMGTAQVSYAQEIVFVISLTIIFYLMAQLIKELSPEQARVLFGTAAIIFVFRAVPLPGAGWTWFQIDELEFDEQFLAILAFITSLLALIGLVVLRPLMARKSIAQVVIFLTLAAGVLSLPNLALYYGLHEWTAAHTNGVVDARFIAVFDTAIESPLGQVAMIPMLAWIARNAPSHLKATFFAVMASFTNMALSASSLVTKYLNEYFVVARAATDPETGKVISKADYNDLGYLLITVACVAVIAPLVTILLVQNSKYRTAE